MTDLYMNYLVRSQTINQSLLGAYLQARAVFSADNLEKTKFICHLGPFVLYWFGYWPLFDHHSDSLHFFFSYKVCYTLWSYKYIPLKQIHSKQSYFYYLIFKLFIFIQIIDSDFPTRPCSKQLCISRVYSYRCVMGLFHVTDSFVLPAIFFLHSFIFKTEFNSLGLGARYDICLD